MYAVLNQTQNRTPKDETPQDKLIKICQACHEAAEIAIAKSDKRGKDNIIVKSFRTNSTKEIDVEVIS